MWQWSGGPSGVVAIGDDVFDIIVFIILLHIAI